METGWLIEIGGLCIGVGSCKAPTLVTFTDPDAIRFARKVDAQKFIYAARAYANDSKLFATATINDHSWG